MTPLRFAVVGCGHLGRYHARLLQQSPSAELVAVVDPFEASRLQLAAETGAEPIAEVESIYDRVDAVVLATPTETHAQLAFDLLNHNIHLLVEKPLTSKYADAKALADIANEHELVLAVGHVERFNPAFLAIQENASDIRYVEAVRSGGFSFRSMDVGAVMDLMIHDLELVLTLVGKPVKSIRAFGMPVVSSREDWALARLEFDGCVADLRASRICPHPERRMTVLGDQDHIYADFNQRKVERLKRSATLQHGQVDVEKFGPVEIANWKERVFTDLTPVESIEVPEANPLADEQADFIAAIESNRAPRVEAHDAANVVWTAERILDQIVESFTSPGIDIRRAA